MQGCIDSAPHEAVSCRTDRIGATNHHKKQHEDRIMTIVSLPSLPLVRTPGLSALALIFALVACGPAPDDGKADAHRASDANTALAEEAKQAKPPLLLDDAGARTVLDEETRAFLATQPLLASFNDLPEEDAGGPYNDRLTDYSPAGFDHVRAVARTAADHLSRISRAGLKPKTRVDLDVVEQVFRYYAGAPAIEYGLIDSYFGHVPYVVSQISGPHLDIPKLMQTQQRLKSEEDVRDYIARLAGFRNAFAGIIAKIEADAAIGAVPPRILIERSLKPVANFIAEPPKRNPLYLALARKITTIPGLSADRRAAWLHEAEDALSYAVYPAYADLKAVLVSLLPRGRAQAGVWAQPDGERFYAHSVRMLGDTTLSPDEIHDIGLKEVDRISKEMDAILRSLGYREGSVGERMVKLGEDPRYLFPDTDRGREEILDYLRTLVKEVNARVPGWFATIPPQKLEIRRIPKFSEAGEAGGFYTNPSIDGKRPGIYWINLRDMKAWPKWSLKTLTYHEAVPGHHFQISIQMNAGDLPLMRKLAPFNAFTEGWALYAERLAAEMGLYKDDPLGNLGRLQDELFRAVRLVVDTGMHAKRWSREKAIDYMYSVTGSDQSEVVPEIERYMAWPGQALGYKLGQLKILELREEARRELGDSFDIKEFHDVVLGDGAVPMAVLEAKVKAWIAQRKAGPASGGNG
ncbi:MAG: DUF885 domain-containing protein [Alphaproteobacteria bacterium]|nr:MAG: DUF885 domain-containing protein [Alphaproteobacteria bacterium]